MAITQPVRRTKIPSADMAITCIKFAASMRRIPGRTHKSISRAIRSISRITRSGWLEKAKPRVPRCVSCPRLKFRNIFRYPMMRRLDSSPTIREEMKYSVMETVLFRGKTIFSARETTTEIPPISNPAPINRP